MQTNSHGSPPLSQLSEDRLRELAAAWGVTAEFWDLFGNFRRVSPEVCRIFLPAMGCDPDNPQPPPASPVSVIPQRTAAEVGAGELTLEDGTTLSIRDRLPHDVPIGYHTLRGADGQTKLLIVRPPSCYWREGLKAWGWGVQIYSVRSEKSWGIGDFDDLRRLARWSHGQGARLMLLNPLGASAPVSPQQNSPYYPSSRCFRNPLYIHVPSVPGASAASVDLKWFAAEGHELNKTPRIDRDNVFHLKIKALEEIWKRKPDHAAVDAYRRQRGELLDTFGAFCVLAEKHGADWRLWPDELRRPDSPGVARIVQASRDRVQFHQWLQALLDQQLAAASREVPLVHDLPIGMDPGGVDAWMWQDTLALNVQVGAPPDYFNALGQNWALPPFAPHKLRAAHYGPLIETLRMTFQHGGGIRIDHVMGLFRLYWIAAGHAADSGAYIRYPADELLAILAIESHRAGAWVAGEDLGTVEPGVRERLLEENILTHKILCFEDDPPERFPATTLAAINTHDLATLAGLWTGADIEAQRRIGLDPHVGSYDQMRNRVRDVAKVANDAGVKEAIVSGYRALAKAPSAVLVASLTDGLAVDERINLPGTLNEWPNWSIPLPMSLETIEKHPLAGQVAEALRRD